MDGKSLQGEASVEDVFSSNDEKENDSKKHSTSKASTGKFASHGLSIVSFFAEQFIEERLNARRDNLGELMRQNPEMFRNKSHINPGITRAAEIYFTYGIDSFHMSNFDTAIVSVICAIHEMKEWNSSVPDSCDSEYFAIYGE